MLRRGRSPKSPRAIRAEDLPRPDSCFDFLAFRSYKNPMTKIFSLGASLGLLLLLSGCESELPESGPRAGDKLRRGLIGQGSLYTSSAETPTPASTTTGR